MALAAMLELPWWALLSCSNVIEHWVSKLDLLQTNSPNSHPYWLFLSWPLQGSADLCDASHSKSPNSLLVLHTLNSLLFGSIWKRDIYTVIPSQDAVQYVFTTQYFQFISMYRMRAMFTTDAFSPCCILSLPKCLTILSKLQKRTV